VPECAPLNHLAGLHGADRAVDDQLRHPVAVPSLSALDRLLLPSEQVCQRASCQQADTFGVKYGTTANVTGRKNPVVSSGRNAHGGRRT
jgi:hypothetical protein